MKEWAKKVYQSAGSMSEGVYLSPDGSFKLLEGYLSYWCLWTDDYDKQFFIPYMYHEVMKEIEDHDYLGKL